MESITAVFEEEVAMKSYELFGATMRHPPSPVYTEEKKWRATRLALHGAYKWDRVFPPVDDPQLILNFLNDHFELVKGGEDHDEPIRDALHALACYSTPKTTEALKNFDPTQPSFVHGICHIFQKHKPLQLHKAALLFLPLIADKWFNSHRPLMNDDEMKKLCGLWAFAVDEVRYTDRILEAALAVLLDMINSSHSRPHVVPGGWQLLVHLDLVPDDSQPLARCLRNPSLVDWIGTVGSPDTVVRWSKVLLSKYDKLDPTVKERLEVFMRGVQRERVDDYLLTMQEELGRAKEESLNYGRWSADDPKAVPLDGMIKSHEAAIEFLESVRKG